MSIDLEKAKQLIAEDKQLHTSYSTEHEDFSYIAFACNNFPEAMAEVERLQAELGKFKECSGECSTLNYKHYHGGINE